MILSWSWPGDNIVVVHFQVEAAAALGHRGQVGALGVSTGAIGNSGFIARIAAFGSSQMQLSRIWSPIILASSHFARSIYSC